MPRRYADYPADPGWPELNLVSTIGALVIAVSVAVLPGRGRRGAPAAGGLPAGPVGGQLARVGGGLAAAAPQLPIAAARSGPSDRCSTRAKQPGRRRDRRRRPMTTAATGDERMSVLRRVLLADHPQETRFFAFIGVFGLVLATIYWFATYELAGTVLLFAFGLAGSVAAVRLIVSRPAKGRPRRRRRRPARGCRWDPRRRGHRRRDRWRGPPVPRRGGPAARRDARAARRRAGGRARHDGGRVRAVAAGRRARCRSRGAPGRGCAGARAELDAMEAADRAAGRVETPTEAGPPPLTAERAGRKAPRDCKPPGVVASRDGTAAALACVPRDGRASAARHAWSERRYHGRPVPRADHPAASAARGGVSGTKARRLSATREPPSTRSSSAGVPRVLRRRSSSDGSDAAACCSTMTQVARCGGR